LSVTCATVGAVAKPQAGQALEQSTQGITQGGGVPVQTWSPHAFTVFQVMVVPAVKQRPYMYAYPLVVVNVKQVPFAVVLMKFWRIPPVGPEPFDAEIAIRAAQPPPLKGGLHAPPGLQLVPPPPGMELFVIHI
jgi:hypothetical protein